MKEKSPSRIRRVFSSIFNIRAWSDWDRTKENTHFFMGQVKNLFVLQKEKRKESFEDAQRRLRLSNEDLFKKQTSLWRLSLLMVGIAALIFMYTVYLLFSGSFRAVFLSLVVMGIALTLAFRYHFWYYQIKERRLGCSLSEWFKKGLLGSLHE